MKTSIKTTETGWVLEVSSNLHNGMVEPSVLKQVKDKAMVVARSFCEPSFWEIRQSAKKNAVRIFLSNQLIDANKIKLLKKKIKAEL